MQKWILISSVMLLMACGDESGPQTMDAEQPDAMSDAEMFDVQPPDMQPPRPYPDPGAWPPNVGPGGPNTLFGADDLYQNCTFLPVPDDTIDHHNLVVMYDGYLLMPWAPEFGIQGGLTFFSL